MNEYHQHRNSDPSEWTVAESDHYLLIGEFEEVYLI